MSGVAWALARDPPPHGARGRRLLAVGGRCAITLPQGLGLACAAGRQVLQSDRTQLEHAKHTQTQVRHILHARYDTSGFNSFTHSHIHLHMQTRTKPFTHVHAFALPVTTHCSPLTTFTQSHIHTKHFAFHDQMSRSIVFNLSAACRKEKYRQQRTTGRHNMMVFVS